MPSDGSRRANLKHGVLPRRRPPPIIRLHRIRVPVAGPREAEAGRPRPERYLLWLHGGDSLLAPMERGAIDPHAMQDSRQLACQSDLVTLNTTPLRHISTSNSLVCSSLRATSSARPSWDPGDLACTGRNHPMRNSCAMPRASLRSVLITIADSAAFTCRVSRSTTSNPAATKPAYSHCDSGPASSPIRVPPVSSPRKNPTRASGSLATFASRTILPAPSTTHTLLFSNDTSIPAKYCMTVLR